MPKLSGSWKTPGSLFFYQTFFMLHVETYASIVHKEFTELHTLKSTCYVLPLDLLFSLVQVQNQSFGPKQNTKFTVNHHPPPTKNFLKGSRHSRRLRLNI